MSTFSPDLRHPGVDNGAGVLESRLIDIPRTTFADDYWGRRALLSRGVSDFSDLFSADAVDELISARGLRSPFLRVAKDGATLPDLVVHLSRRCRSDDRRPARRHPPVASVP